MGMSDIADKRLPTALFKLLITESNIGLPSDISSPVYKNSGEVPHTLCTYFFDFPSVSGPLNSGTDQFTALTMNNIIANTG
jgi:hypothetical protein